MWATAANYIKNPHVHVGVGAFVEVTLCFGFALRNFKLVEKISLTATTRFRGGNKGQV